MAETKSSNRPLLTAILVIVSINLVLFAIMVFFVMVSASDNAQTTTSEITEVKPLPSDLASEENREILFEELRLAYNSNDRERILSRFGKSYQMDLRANDFDAMMHSLYSFASAINTGAYSHYESNRLDNGLDKFTLHYTIDTPEGLRKITLTFTQQGDSPSALMSFHISS